MLAIIKPNSYSHRVFNLVYTFFSVLALVGVYLNFKKKMYCFNMPSLLLLVIRIAVRMLDKEESYEGFGAYYWQYMLVVSMCAVLMNIHIALNFCKNNWITYLTLVVLFFFSIFCLLYGIEVGIHFERNEPFVF